MKTPIFLLCCAVAFQSYAQADSTVLSLLKQAGEASKKSNYLKAIKLYDNIITQVANEGKYYFYRGQAYMMIQESQKALADYNKTAELSPQFYEAYLSRAILFYNLNEPEKAINDYNMALRYCQDTIMRIFVYNNRGNTKILRQDLQGAYLDYLEAYKLDNLSIATMSNIASVLNQMKRGHEALMFLKRVLELQPRDITTRSDMGYAYMSLDMFKEAIEQYDMVLLSDPNEPIALSNRGLAKFNLQEYDAALADLDKAISLLPQNAYSYRNRGMLLMALGDKNASCNDFAKALRYGFTEKYDDEVRRIYRNYCTEGSR